MNVFILEFEHLYGVT